MKQYYFNISCIDILCLSLCLLFLLRFFLINRSLFLTSLGVRDFALICGYLIGISFGCLYNARIKEVEAGGFEIFPLPTPLLLVPTTSLVLPTSWCFFCFLLQDITPFLPVYTTMGISLLTFSSLTSCRVPVSPFLLGSCSPCLSLL